MAALLEFWDKKELFLNDLDFYRSMLLNLQQDPTNTNSQCITTFDEFIILANTLKAGIADDASYYAGLAEKGQGSGTEVGLAIDHAQKYIDGVIFGVNVFNYCDLDYYLVAVGKSVGSASGAVNQLVNLFYRFFSWDDQVNFYNMSVAVYEEDVETVGETMGKFLAALLMVEVPDTT